ncbi:uncharacterized protein LOC110678880 isoform X2 [Aedes aegypti]|uniref:Uncharacterized protein n=1 Tax=Aedes aegypti TaxID=7159 RepID=A0A6I8TYP5_AEDAE|nr:uncharacterized protein LOC110678880 isoform X2 [Aedes aegypti]
MDDIPVDVKLIDIIDYVGDSVRPIREGSAVHDAKHIICIGYTAKHLDCVEISGYVCQSSHPNQIPHKVELKLADSIDNWVLKCSCKAGTNRCKHIVACLLELNRTGKAEYMTCTSATQAWGTTKAEKSVPWGAKPIAELCCVHCPKRAEPTDAALKNNILAESFSRILRGR